MNILLTLHHALDPNAGAPGAIFRTGESYLQRGHQVSYFSFDNVPQILPEIAKTVLFPEFVAAHVRQLQHIDIIEAMTGDAWLWQKLFHRQKSDQIISTQSQGLEHIVHLECLEDAKRAHLKLSWKYPLYHGGLRLWEVSNSLRGADLVFLLNQQDRDYATGHIGVNPSKAHVIPNGISEAFLGLPFYSTPLDENIPIKIAQIGRYILRKGIHYTATALNSILAKYPHVEISFIGTGCPLEEVHRDFASEFRGRVHVVPHYSNQELPQLLKDHQIKLLPSLSEGFGIAIVEAMACGLVPIATTVQGPKEIITDGKDGYLVPPRDAAAIEKSLIDILENRHRLEHLRRCAYSTAQNYSWANIADKKLALYETLLSQRKHRL